MSFKEYLQELNEASMTIDVNFGPAADVEEVFPKWSKKFKLKFGNSKKSGGGIDYEVTGSKNNLIKFLTDKDAYGLSKDELPEYFPELNESIDDEFVMQKLADKDINSKIEKNTVYVDKTDVKEAEKILKSIGCKKQLKEMK